MLFLLSTRSTLAIHTAFLETDMRVAWAALLDAGSSSSGDPREIVNTMLADCHGRKNGGWGAECDRALYLESVLKEVGSIGSIGSSSSSGAGAGGSLGGLDTNATDVADEEWQQRAALDSAANDIAVVSAEHLPFSTFFHEYAVPRRPVVIRSGRSDCGDAIVDIASGEEQENLSHRGLDPADDAADTLQEHEHGLGVDESLLSAINACMPYPVGPTGSGGADTVEGPLRACHESLLESLVVPLQVSEDFAQRFRGQGVLPVREHADVERFVSG